MPLALDKILSALAFPLGSGLALLALGWLGGLLGRRRIGAGVALIGLLWLWLWSTPWVADALVDGLVADFPPQAAEALPVADVIVVLGGGMSGRDGDRVYPDLGDGADRVWHAARLHRAGRAPRILLSGGQVWPGGPQTEADAMRGLLVELGVPDRAILIEGGSRNTRENALQTAALLERDRLGRVLLVTSAMHMRRALATFAAAGVDAVPAPTDHGMPSRAPWLLRWLPDAGALERSTGAFKEHLGLLVYRWRGWA